MTTVMTQAVQAMEALVLGYLGDGRVWGREELAARLADEVGWEAAALVPKAVERLIEAGRVDRVGDDLLRVSDSASGVGVVEPVNSPDLIRGGAEGLPDRLVPAGAGD